MSKYDALMINGHKSKCIAYGGDYMEHQSPLLCFAKFIGFECKHQLFVRCGCKDQGTYTIYFVSVVNSNDVTPDDAIYSITSLTAKGTMKTIHRLAKSGTKASDFNFNISATLDTADDTYASYMKKIVEGDFDSTYIYSNFVGKGSPIDFNRAFWRIARKLANPTDKLPPKENVHFTERKKQTYE